MSDSPDRRQHEILLDSLCCVMVADGTASQEEKSQIAKLMSDAGSLWTSDEVARRMRGFGSRVRSMGFRLVLNRTCSDVYRLRNTDSSRILESCLAIADADQHLHQIEKKVIARIRKSLEQPEVPEEPLQPTREQMIESELGPLRSARITPRQRFARIAISLCCAFAPAAIPAVQDSPGLNGRGMYLTALAGFGFGLVLVYWIEFTLGIFVPAIADFRNASASFDRRRALLRMAAVTVAWFCLPPVWGGVSYSVTHWKWEWPLFESLVASLLSIVVGIYFTIQLLRENFELTVISSESNLITDKGEIAYICGEDCDIPPAVHCLMEHRNCFVRGIRRWRPVGPVIRISNARPVQYRDIDDNPAASPMVMIREKTARKRNTRAMLITLLISAIVCADAAGWKFGSANATGVIIGIVPWLLVFSVSAVVFFLSDRSVKWRKTWNSVHRSPDHPPICAVLIPRDGHGQKLAILERDGLQNRCNVP